ARHLDGLACLRIDLPDGMELVGHVHERRLVAPTLFCDRMDYHRSAVVLGLLEYLDERANVMTVDRPQVLDVEVRVQGLVVAESSEEATEGAANTPVEGPARS